MTAEFVNPNLPQAWKVEQVRLSTFYAELKVPLDVIWSSVSPTSPTNESTERSGPITVHQANGVVDDYTLGLRLEPNRIDWFIGLPPTAMPMPFGNVVGDYEPTVSRFAELMKPFLCADFVPVARVAVGVQLSYPVEKREEGYMFLSGLLPFDLSLESRDFYYRINRRRRSGVVDVDINRLSEWLVLELFSVPVMVGQAFGGNLAAGPPSPFNTPSTFAARLQMDINTAPEQPLEATGERLSDLLDELVGFTSEIATTGDRA